MIRRGICAVAGLCACVLASAAPAAAADFTVTRFDDPAPNACASGDCSLREAIRAANAAAGADTIALEAGTYQLALPGLGEDAALDGDLDVTDDLTLTGAGAGQTTIDASGTGERVLELDPLLDAIPVTIAISDLRVTDGSGSFGAGMRIESEARATLDRVSISDNDGASFGGAIFHRDDAVSTIRDSTIAGNSISSEFANGVMNQNDARLTIERTLIRDNEGPLNMQGGGGVMNQNDARLTIRDSTIAGNSLAGRGAGLFLKNDSVTTVEDSVVSGNVAGGAVLFAEVGAGMAIENQAVVTVRNSTVTGNRADDAGGGIRLQDTPTVRLESTTVSDNTADDDGDGGATEGGGGAFVEGGTLTLANSIVAGNSRPGSPDCAGVIGSAGFNLIGDASGCAFTDATGDQVGSAAAPIDPLLGPLGANGGPTETMALLAGSPAVGAGNPDPPGSGADACPATDQRGAPREDCDTGAYELVECKGLPATLFAVEGVPTLGTEAGEVIFGTPANDVINSGAGDDTVCAGDGKDKVSGKAGKDRLLGEDGKDKLKGGSGKDKLKGGAGGDRLDCGPGKDRGSGGPGRDRLKKCEQGRP